MDEAFQQSLAKEQDIRKGLKKFYYRALDVYSSDDIPLGCMLWSTAPAATLIHPEVQTDLLNAIKNPTPTNKHTIANIYFIIFLMFVFLFLLY